MTGALALPPMDHAQLRECWRHVEPFAPARLWVSRLPIVTLETCIRSTRRTPLRPLDGVLLGNLHRNRSVTSAELAAQLAIPIGLISYNLLIFRNGGLITGDIKQGVTLTPAGGDALAKRVWDQPQVTRRAHVFLDLRPAAGPQRLDVDPAALQRFESVAAPGDDALPFLEQIEDGARALGDQRSPPLARVCGPVIVAWPSEQGQRCLLLTREIDKTVGPIELQAPAEVFSEPSPEAWQKALRDWGEVAEPKREGPRLLVPNGPAEEQWLLAGEALFREAVCVEQRSD